MEEVTEFYGRCLALCRGRLDAAAANAPPTAGGTLSATVVEADPRVAGLLIGELMRWGADVELYLWWPRADAAAYTAPPGDCPVTDEERQEVLYGFLPDFARVPTGSLSVYAHEARPPFRAVLEGAFVALGPYSAATGGRGPARPAARTGGVKLPAVAAAGTAQYDLLAGEVERFCFDATIADRDVGPALYIERGRIRRLWGDDDDDD